MSHIVIYLDKEANRADVVLRLQKVTQQSLSNIRTALANNAPIVEVELFEGDYDSHAAMLRGLLSCLDEMSLSSRIYEVPESEMMETCTFVDKCEISPSVLENILNEADAELDRQLGE